MMKPMREPRPIAKTSDKSMTHALDRDRAVPWRMVRLDSHDAYSRPQLEQRLFFMNGIRLIQGYFFIRHESRLWQYGHLILLMTSLLCCKKPNCALYYRNATIIG